ncbi:hypothetical protein ACI2UK_13970 [Ralstonia nicotianae]|uniref:hypothetical protein n=1 Tax=Ralstonia pseudosolanacearum TaxID=1310165 RepID=UPI002002AC2B|nr:hypothetical protein [Ralstonia pseudosolanacearum]MCK4118349.1 hypothetical protein [Ralstonia pseudosolanacearum]
MSDVNAYFDNNTLHDVVQAGVDLISAKANKEKLDVETSSIALGGFTTLYRPWRPSSATSELRPIPVKSSITTVWRSPKD